jgi:hypothetical protein
VAEAIKGTIRCHLRVLIFENAVLAWVGSQVRNLGFLPIEGSYIRGVSRENEFGERVGRVVFDADDSQYIEVVFYSPLRPEASVAEIKEHFGDAWSWEERI